jgi:hypothetical protein
MKKIIVVILIVASLLLVKPAMAEYQRLKKVDSELRFFPSSLSKDRMFVVYDEVEKINCYVIETTDSRAGYAIDCLPTK